MKETRYFSRYTTTRGQLSAAFRNNLDRRLDKFLEGKANGTSKMCVKQVITSSAGEILSMEMDSFDEVIQHIESMQESVKRCESLKAAIDGLEDDKSKSAVLLFKRISEEQPGDDNNARCRRITAAGLIVASYLGGNVQQSNE